MPQTHISALHTGVGAGALLTAVCGSVVIVRVCGGAVGIGAISLGRENVEKLPSSEDASYTQVHLYTEALMFTFQIVSKYKAGPLWPPAKHFLSISQIFFCWCLRNNVTRCCRRGVLLRRGGAADGCGQRARVLRRGGGERDPRLHDGAGDPPGAGPGVRHGGGQPRPAQPSTGWV